MAAKALLSLSQPLYAGFKSEADFIKKNPDIVGRPGSLKRLKSIPYAFSSFGEGFIKAGGGERIGKQLVGMKKEGGMNYGLNPPVHSAMGGGHILAGAAGAGLVLGHLPAAAMIRERMRAGGDLRRPVMG